MTAKAGLSTDRLWTAEDVAVYLNKTPGGVLKAARDGRLPIPPKTKYPHTWSARAWLRWADR